jgi:hypothetical protein
MLRSSPDPRRLVKGTNKDGNSALAMVCMDGHLEIVRLLCKHDPDLESVNNEGKTPLMVALSYGHGGIATHLIWAGASLVARGNEGKSGLDIAKTTLKDMERIHSRGKDETLARCHERKRNREHFTKVIDLSNARLKNLKAMKKVPSNSFGKKQSFAFTKSGNGRATEISVYLHKFTAPMADEEKTFAYLSRGSLFEDMFAVSRYSQGCFGGVDGCLDREEWTAKVFMFSQAIGHGLKAWPEKDKNHKSRRLGSFYACHAEKQVMAYFLWKHATLQGEVTCYSDKELQALEKSKPHVLRVKEIYVTRDPYGNWKKFQKKIRNKTGIDFNVIFVPSDNPASDSRN